MSVFSKRQHTFILRPLRYNRRRLNSSLTQTEAIIFKRDRDLPRTALAVTVVGALWFILLRHLSNEWSVNEQYGYGWFVPFFAAYLFWLRWQDRPAIEIRNSKLEIRRRQAIAALVSISALLVLFPLRLFEIGNPDWRPLGWLHAAITVF